jgi:nucleotide-binding universal stress UspA family protein
MFRDILVVFDNEKVCPESLTYAREFALRMDVRVTLLVLVPMDFGGKTFLGSKRHALNRIEDRAAQLLARCSEPFIQQGIEVSSALKVGSSPQELLKFLADRPPFQAAIWGSDTQLPGKGHWIGKVSGSMECPLLTVSRKIRP